MWSAFDEPGLIQAIMTIFDACELMKESLRTMVSLDALNGMWLLLLSRALIHSLRASKLLLISAPSSLLCRLLLWQSAALSEPAKSTRSNLPCGRPLILMEIWQIACDLDEVSFAVVAWVVLTLWPYSMIYWTSLDDFAALSSRP